MSDIDKEIYLYRLARCALAINKALADQQGSDSINLNKAAEYVLKMMDDMDIPIAEMTPWDKFMAGLSK